MDAKELPTWARRPTIHRCVNGIERFTDWLHADIGDDRYVQGPDWLKLGHWRGLILGGMIVAVFLVGIAGILRETLK